MRREEQVELLKKEYNAEYVLNQTDEDFESKLEELSKKLKPNVAFEVVSGTETGKIMKVLDQKGLLINYGKLSGEPIGGIDSIMMINKAHRMETFFLPYWLQSKGIFALISAMKRSTSLTKMVTINKSFGLHQINDAIAFYKENMTAGKVLLKPSLTV